MITSKDGTAADNRRNWHSENLWLDNLEEERSSAKHECYFHAHQQACECMTKA